MSVEGWNPPNSGVLEQVLIASGVVKAEHARSLIASLTQAGWLVSDRYYVPTMRELFGMYSALGYAYLDGRISARWVMCAETHNALAERYTKTRHAPHRFMRFADADVLPSVEVLHHAVETVMNNRRWSETSVLFGMPIRIDPAARRPMFEIGDDPA